MKITISFLYFFLLLLQISSQQQNINNSTSSETKNQQQQKEETAKISNQTNTQQSKVQTNANNNQQNLNNNKNKNDNIKIQNLTSVPKEEIPKKDNNNRGINPKGGKKEKDKNFNLTESLIKFYNENFGQKNESANNTNSKTKEEMEQMKKENEAEMQQKLLRERDQRRREYFEAREKAELIRIEYLKKEQKKKEQEEKVKFENILANTSFDDIIQIAIEREETESLYFNLSSFTKIKIAVVLTDEDEKFNFALSGPNARGRTSVLYRADNKNYLFYEYETLRNGEYIIELINKGSKENEIVFLISGTQNKQKDNINTEKIDKISLLLNNIDNNIYQLKNKKKIEMLKVKSHNEKVDENNKYIVIYSIIEIFTMIIVFVSQSYYISSLVNKI